MQCDISFAVVSFKAKGPQRSYSLVHLQMAIAAPKGAIALY